MSRLGDWQLQDSSSAAAAVPFPPSFELGPTAHEAKAWTRLRRRLSPNLQPSGEPLFSSDSFDSALLVEQAGWGTHLRRSLNAAEVAAPPLPRLSVSQLGALLGAFVLTCAAVRPWEGIQGGGGSDSAITVPRRTPEDAIRVSPHSLAAVRTEVVREQAERAAYRQLDSIQARLVNGEAVLPANAPEELRQVVAAANRINERPYSYGGGHGSFESAGYDCSGAVSYALHGGGMLSSPLASGGFTSWGEPGPGKAITVYAHGGHAYAVIAGLRWDTSGSGSSGPRWHEDMRSPAGYVVRHPPNF